MHTAGGLTVHCMCHLDGHARSSLHALLFQGAHATLLCRAVWVACLQKALDLSDAQLQDLLHISHLMLVKENLLEMERKVESSGQTNMLNDLFVALEAVGDKLKDNVLQVQKGRFAAGTAIFYGVSNIFVVVQHLSCPGCEKHSGQVSNTCLLGYEN